MHKRTITRTNSRLMDIYRYREVLYTVTELPLSPDVISQATQRMVVLIILVEVLYTIQELPLSLDVISQITEWIILEVLYKIQELSLSLDVISQATKRYTHFFIHLHLVSEWTVSVFSQLLSLSSLCRAR